MTKGHFTTLYDFKYEVRPPPPQVIGYRFGILD